MTAQDEDLAPLLDEQAPSAALARPKSIFREYTETIIVCVLVLLFARAFVFVQSKIPTGSMIGSILVGDYILVDSFLYGAPGDEALLLPGQRKVQRGDVIVFRFPRDPDVDFVKRVVGLPGETIKIDHGQVFVDGEALEENYVGADAFDPRTFPTVDVPEGHFFVLGDNRRNSEDSRYWGMVPRSLIRGRAFFIWYSYEEEPNSHLITGWRRLGAIARKIPQLPFKTRWNRIFKRIR